MSGLDILFFRSVLCPSLCPEELNLTDYICGPSCWLSSGWIQSMAGTGPRNWGSRVILFPISFSTMFLLFFKYVFIESERKRE